MRRCPGTFRVLYHILNTSAIDGLWKCHVNFQWSLFLGCSLPLDDLQHLARNRLLGIGPRNHRRWCMVKVASMWFEPHFSSCMRLPCHLVSCSATEVLTTSCIQHLSLPFESSTLLCLNLQPDCCAQARLCERISSMLSCGRSSKGPTNRQSSASCSGWAAPSSTMSGAGESIFIALFGVSKFHEVTGMFVCSVHVNLEIWKLMRAVQAA